MDTARDRIENMGKNHAKHSELIFNKVLRIHNGESISPLKDDMKIRYIHGKDRLICTLNYTQKSKLNETGI